MTHTQRLIARIKALAEKQGKAPATVAGAILGSGQALANLEAGKTITLAKFEKACEALDRLEGDAQDLKAARHDTAISTAGVHDRAA